MTRRAPAEVQPLWSNRAARQPAPARAAIAEPAARRAAHALSACEAALQRADEEDCLLHDACRAIVEGGGYRLAWVGYAAQDDTRSIRPMAHWGTTAGHLDGFPASWDESPRGHCPVGAAIRSGMPVAVDDVRSDPRFAPWRAAAMRNGYLSCVALPLYLDAGAFGALAVYSAQPDTAGTETLSLLAETAAHLAVGIASLRARP